jgi:hypothetical protein
VRFNVYTYFSQRELDFLPFHFVSGQTILTQESHRWILENTTGRFYIQNKTNTHFFLPDEIPWFENPLEAMTYQLTWS